VGLAEGELAVEVRLAAPVQGIRDERTGRTLPDGDRLSFRFDAAESALFSFQGPPRGTPSARHRASEELYP
jgi:hypothetical protein